MNYSEIIKKYKECTKEENDELKVDFSKLEGVYEGIEKEINFKNYLPYNVKIGIASMLAINICEIVGDEILYINPINQEMIEDLILLNYTDIEKDNNYDIEDYDLLKACGFFDELKNSVVNKNKNVDYWQLINLLIINARQLIKKTEMENNTIIKYARKITSELIDKLVDINTTPEGKKAFRNVLKGFNDNKELMEALQALSSKNSLENFKEELLARINKAKEVEKANKAKKE